MIDSCEFIASHSLLSDTLTQHLLVWYEDSLTAKKEDVKYVCFVDDETLTEQRHVPTFPQSVQQLDFSIVVGISQGLVCLYGFVRNPTSDTLVLWNPSLRKSIAVAPPPCCRTSCVGFGVCPVTHDPKMVIKQYCEEAMVYTLSSGKWKTLSTNLPTIPAQVRYESVVVTDQFIYWPAVLRTRNIIISFDLTNEFFEVIDLPSSLAIRFRSGLCISKRKGSLVIFEGNMISTVWTMEGGGGVQRSFTKLFTIDVSVDNILGFRKSGVPIVQVNVDDDDDDGVVGGVPQILHCFKVKYSY